MATQPAQRPDESADLAAVTALLAAQAVEEFTQAEQDLIREVADAARHGLAAPAGSAARLDMLRRMRAIAQRIAVRMHASAGPIAAQVTEEARRRGTAAATRRLTALAASHPDLLPTLTAAQPEPISAHALAAVTKLRLDLQSRLSPASLRITRFGDDAYRAAVARAAVGEILTGGSPAMFQRQAWDELTAKGVDGFVDVRGRHWNLASYVEMATRTAVQRAYLEAHHDRMTAAGIEFFTVAPHAHPCPLCAPWEGRVLSDMPLGTMQARSVRGTGSVSFTVVATVDQARAGGLFHPNCTHTLVAYFPGVTTLPDRSDWTEHDQAAYAAAQQLRALERRVRALKRVELGALNDLDRARARKRIRLVQAQIRDHVARHGLTRRSRREQLDLGAH